MAGGAPKRVRRSRLLDGGLLYEAFANIVSYHRALDMNVRNPCARRPLSCPRNESSELFIASANQRFDAAFMPVAHPPGNA